MTEVMPALLTRMLTGPTSARRRRACASVVRSATNPRITNPCRCASATRSWMRSLVLVMATRCPRRARSIAVAKPMPLADPQPVTSASRGVSDGGRTGALTKFPSIEASAAGRRGRCAEPGIDVSEHIEHAVVLEHLTFRCAGDVVPGRHAQGAVDIEVHIHHDHVAHLARAQIGRAH